MAAPPGTDTSNFKTTITGPEPLGKQGQVLHPEQNRILSVRQLARSQGFPDIYGDRHRGSGMPCRFPWALGRALGLDVRMAIFSQIVSNPGVNDV